MRRETDSMAGEKYEDGQFCLDLYVLFAIMNRYLTNK